ncbi:lysophospholipase L1-like esterase [Streptacidiphilus sp. MAP12-33]|uniref:SGNH/GDSL hydrolase family protein n=1 Tax=Streptacidiphilus sp. MAP12-33 TaxID=3156266 RepID=UPI003516F3D1
MRIRRAGAAVVTAVLCAALGACAGSGRPAAAPTAPPKPTATASPAPLVTGPYVALGDSYTAGPGIPEPTGTPTGCARSSQSYPALLAARLRLAPSAFRDVSCSGAQVAELTRRQVTADGVNPAQLSALTPATRLVTLGIGGNDIGFADLVGRCVTAGLLRKTPCREQLTAGGEDSVEARITAAGEHLAGVLAEIHRRAPRARLLVVGYPDILPADGASCAASLAISAGDVAYLRTKEQHLNAMLRQRSRAAGAGFVDTWTPSLGHDACAPAATRWIEPLLPTAPAGSMHPNARGEAGMAAAVLAILGERSS